MSWSPVTSRVVRNQVLERLNTLVSMHYRLTTLVCSAPYKIIQINNNGTVRLNEGVTTDTYNVRNITPYPYLSPQYHDYGAIKVMHYTLV